MDVQALKIDRSQTKTRKRRGPSRGSAWLWRGGVLAVLALAVWLFWAPINRSIDRVRLPKVAVSVVELSHPATVSAVSGTAANGHVVAARRAALSADTPGRIVELNVTEGSMVKRGDVVARLFADEFAAALQRAKAELVSAEARVIRANASHSAAIAELQSAERNLQAAKARIDEENAAQKLAMVRYRRANDLFRQGIGAESAVDDAIAGMETARARVESAKALLRAAEATKQDRQHRVGVASANRKVAKADVDIAIASRDQAAATLDKTIVRAPFDGIVVLKDAEVGEVVSPNSQGGSNARGSVCTMVDRASLEVQADVQETSLAKVKLGAQVNIYLDAYPDQVYRGRVDRIWPTADRRQATVEVRIAFLQPDQRLRPDMGVRVVFLDKTGKEAAASQPTKRGPPQILVPQEAIVEIDGKPGAFILERDAVRFQPLTLGSRRAGRVTVQSGLRAGQRIVLDPPSDLQTGSRVRL